MKNLFAKFLSLSLKMKIITVAVPSILVIGAVATPIIINANKEPIEVPIDVAEATVEPTIESTEEPTTVPVIEKTEDETVVEPEVIESEVEETIVEEPTEVVETEVEEPEVNTPPTEVDENADVNVPVDAGETYNFEGDNKVEAYEATVPDNYELPYIVNGRDIRGGDIDGDGVTDNHGNTWYQGQVFVGSNGVKVRIADGYDVQPMLPHPDAVFRDGTENIEPGSDWQIAVNEYLGRADINNVTGDNLPQVNTVSSKQTTINDTDPSYLAYKAAFDPVWQVQNKGTYVEGGLSMLQTFDKGHDGTVDGIGLIDSMGSLNYMWTLEYDYINGYWKLEILGNYTELIWNSIHNSIRMITPDADAVYNAIYESCYSDYPGLVIEPYTTGNWVSIGNTEVRADGSTGSLYYHIR